MSRLSITVVGAGIFGLWQALVLSQRGHRVTLLEATADAAGGGASRFAGAMLAPYCEAEAAEPIVKDLGLRGLALWRETLPAVVVARGSLVIATARDHSELVRFQRATEGHRVVDATEIASLEPDLAGRFSRGLLFETEAHVAPRAALAELVAALRREGVELCFGQAVADPSSLAAPDAVIIDCRGMGARGDLPSLRGVRGEMAVLRAPEVNLSRTVRLLHPRFPLYLVPWGDGLYMIGATVIEREDARPVTVRSALDLLGTAYAIHPGFAEAEIVELSAGVRPAFPDNIPKVVTRGGRLFVNGAYRHGYLLAPVMAEIVADHLETGASHRLIVTDG